MVTIYLYLIGPLSSSPQRIKAVTNINPHLVTGITLQPSSRPDFREISMIYHDLMITDSVTLQRICYLLRQSVSAESGYLKSPNQAGRIKITFRDQPPTVLGFKKVNDATCIIVASNVESGWQYGLLKVPDLGPLLDSIASAK